MSQNLRRVPSRRVRSYATPLKARGLSLVELMVAMLIGLMVIASASAIFMSNRETYRATESLGRVQESGRVAFELMTRDIRSAAGNACAKNLLTINVLTNANTQWWNTWGNGIAGYDGPQAAPGLAVGAARGQRIGGTDVIEIKGADNASGVTISGHSVGSQQFQVNTTNHPLNNGDIAIVCDFRTATIMQIASAQPNVSTSIVYNAGAPVRPYPGNSMIARLTAARWYIGSDGNNGRSLFRSQLAAGPGGVSQIVPQEIASGVRDLRVTYLTLNGIAYRDATQISAANAWGNVAAVRVELDLEGTDRVGTDLQGLQRNFAHTVTLRNRVP
jgi:type IV pilus assembly protein PilW